MKEIKKYKCNKCGHSFISNSYLEKCLFCGDVLTDYENDTFTYVNSFYVKPFIKTREDAIKDYKRKVFFNPIIPFIFKSKKTYNSVHKIFLASNISDYNITGDIKFIYLDNNQFKHETLNTVNMVYKDILNCKNSKLNKSLFNTYRDDYNNLARFTTDDLSDSIILEGNLELEESFKEINKNIINNSLEIVKDNIKYDNKKVIENNLNISNINSKNILIPFYLISISYNNHNYMYLMNASNGKSFIDLTFGKRELIVFSLLIFGLIVFMGFLIAYFF